MSLVKLEASLADPLVLVEDNICLRVVRLPGGDDKRFVAAAADIARAGAILAAVLAATGLVDE